MIYKKRVVVVNDNDLSNDINSAQEAADSAILEQQRIYYRSKEGRIPYGAADPTDIWITNHDDRYNELSNENAATAWSTKITPIARGIDSNENEDKYLYLYTCIQKRIVSKDAVKYTLSSDTTVNASKLYYERSGMTDNYVYTVISNPSGNPHENQYYEQSPKVPHTEILLDETTTVIDGGKIITGSIMANRLNAGDINAWHQLSIGAFDAETTKAISNSTYITFMDTQRGIHVHNVDDENNYVQINATDIQLVRANVPRMILGATNFSFHDANGTQRLLLNANDGAIIGYTSNIYTQIKNDGFYIYDGASSQTNKKLTQIASSGLEIFDSTDGSSIAFYGQATRIGRAQKQRMEITSNDLRFYDTFNKVMLQFAAIKKNSSSTTNDAPWLCIGDASATRITLGITDAPYLYMNAGGTQCFSATSSGVQVGSSTNYALINTNGMEVFKGGTTAANSRAQFFDTIRLGSSTGQRITLSSTALEMYDSGNDRRVRVNSGEGVILGHKDRGRAVITDQGMTIYDVNNADVAFYGSSARIGAKANNKTRLELSNTAMNIIFRNSSGTDTNISSFGSTVLLGQSNQYQLSIDNSKIKFLNKGTEIGGIKAINGFCYMQGANVGIESTASNGACVYCSSDDVYIESTDEIQLNTETLHIYASTHPHYPNGYTMISHDVDCENSLQVEGTFYNGSDKKLKDNISSINFAEELIMSLKPVTYMFKKGKHTRKHMGLIAQEVAATCIELQENLSLVRAQYNEKTTGEYYGERVDDNLLKWSLAYQELIAPMIQVIQSQNKQLKEQHKEIEQLKKEVAELKK